VLFRSRRYNLIPNLVETVKGYATHEKETLEKVIQARNAAMSNEGSPAEQAKSENILQGALKSIFALSESYPDLKANQNFLELQRELTDAEDKIQASRRFYNTNVRDLNIKVEQFPSALIANLFHFHKEEFFELGEEAEAASKPVEVKF
jgi:LemA protein